MSLAAVAIANSRSNPPPTDRNRRCVGTPNANAGGVRTITATKSKLIPNIARCVWTARGSGARHPDYWRKYRETHQQAVEENRRKQHDRDQAQRLADLANHNLASGQVFVLEALVRQSNVASGPCKQNPLAQPPVLPDKQTGSLMLIVEQINSIHNLQAERWSVPRIARQLQMDTRIVKKYLLAPVQTPVSRPRASRLDTFTANPIL